MKFSAVAWHRFRVFTDGGTGRLRPRARSPATSKFGVGWLPQNLVLVKRKVWEIVNREIYFTLCLIYFTPYILSWFRERIYSSTYATLYICSRVQPNKMPGHNVLCGAAKRIKSLQCSSWVYHPTEHGQDFLHLATVRLWQAFWEWLNSTFGNEFLHNRHENDSVLHTDNCKYRPFVSTRHKRQHNNSWRTCSESRE